MTKRVPRDVELILSNLRDESDRAFAIVGVALIEHFLERAIQVKLRPISSSVRFA